MPETPVVNLNQRCNEGFIVYLLLFDPARVQRKTL